MSKHKPKSRKEYLNAALKHPRILVIAMLVLHAVPFLFPAAWRLAARWKENHDYNIIAVVLFLALAAGLLPLALITFLSGAEGWLALTILYYAVLHIGSFYVLWYRADELLMTGTPQFVQTYPAAGSPNANNAQRAPTEEDLRNIRAGKMPAALLNKQRSVLDPPETLPLEPIDINAAEQEDLAALPRIGSVLALTIVAERNKNGRFESLDDLCLRCSIKPHIRIAIAWYFAFGKTPAAASTLPVRKGRKVD